MANADAQLFIDGAWVSKPGYGERGGYEFQYGPDVETGIRPNSLSITLANDDLSMDPSNVAGPLYGKIGRNTRTRVRFGATTVMWGEASAWAPEATMEHKPTAPGQGSVRGVAWVNLRAEGLLRRLGRWTEPVETPMYRQTLSYRSVLLGYYPLDDPTGASSIRQAAPGIVDGGGFTGDVVFGEDGPPGSSLAMKMNAGGMAVGGFYGPNASGWQACVSMALGAIPASSTHTDLFVCRDTQGRDWHIQAASGGFKFMAIDGDGTTVLGSTSVGGFGGPKPPTEWTQYRIKVTASGGTVTGELAWYRLDDPFVYLASVSFPGSTGQPSTWYIDGSAAASVDTRYSTVLAVRGLTQDTLSGNAVRAFNAFKDERAGERFARLMSEAGLSSYHNGNMGTTVPMGRQRPGLLLDLLLECVVTEGGMMGDTHNDIALTFYDRSNLAGRTPALALDVSQVVYPIRKRIDDVDITNEITIENADGSKAVATLSSGPISTELPPAGVGLVKGTIDTNLANSRRLQDRAQWELSRSTIDRPRYDEVTVDLFANPGLAATVAAMRPGNWISITGLEPETVYLRAISWRRSGSTVQDKVTFSCVPADAWQVAKIDDTSGQTGRIDSSSTTLNASITASATSIVVKTANPVEVWSVAGGYDVVIDGERIGVPLGGMGAPTGTAPNVLQTITGAVRAKNGVAQAHAAGAQVHLGPVRYRVGY